MKTIEQFSLENVVLIEQYLYGELPPATKRLFLSRLRTDRELRADFDLMVSLLEQDGVFATNVVVSSKAAHARTMANAEVSMLDEVKGVVKNGVLAVGLAAVLVLSCTLLVFFL